MIVFQVWREDFKDLQISLFLTIRQVFKSIPVIDKSIFHQKPIPSQVN